MIAAVMRFAREEEAVAEAQALAARGWFVKITGPVDGLDIWDGRSLIGGLAGGWIAFASRRPLFDP